MKKGILLGLLFGFLFLTFGSYCTVKSNDLCYPKKEIKNQSSEQEDHGVITIP